MASFHSLAASPRLSAYTALPPRPRTIAPANGKRMLERGRRGFRRDRTVKGECNVRDATNAAAASHVRRSAESMRMSLDPTVLVWLRFGRMLSYVDIHLPKKKKKENKKNVMSTRSASKPTYPSKREPRAYRETISRTADQLGRRKPRTERRQFPPS